MTLDTVTLSWKRPGPLANCLRSIIDNTSDRLHRMYVIVNEYNIEYNQIRNISDKIRITELAKNEGVVARNHGFNLSNSDFIAQVDDDVTVNPGWDEKAFSMLEGDVKGVGEDGSWVIPDLSNYSIPGTKPHDGDYVDVLTGFCWIFKNERLLYDEEFKMHWHEETDLQFQMREAGYRFKVCSGMCVHHHGQKVSNWMEYHDPNVKRIQDKWLHKKDKLNLEEPK